MVGAEQHVGMTTGSVLLVGDLAAAAAHTAIVEIGIVVVAVEHRVGLAELFGNAAQDAVGPADTGKHVAHGIVEGIG